MRQATTQKTAQKTALVTGASRGLGRVLADFLARQGYRLVITARGREALYTTADELRRHTEVIAVPGDVADPAHRQTLAEAAGGGLELLLNNASDLGTTPLPPLTTYDSDRLREVFESNLFAPLELVKVTLPALKASRGLVVNLSSDAALGGYEGWGAYGSSKAALDLVSTTLANELRDEGVGVVSVDPGDMRTQMHQDAFPGEDISERPLPEVTLPFWAWLLGQGPLDISGQRFQAQADVWTVARQEVTA